MSMPWRLVLDVQNRMILMTSEPYDVKITFPLPPKYDYTKHNTHIHNVWSNKLATIYDFPDAKL